VSTEVADEICRTHTAIRVLVQKDTADVEAQHERPGFSACDRHHTFRLAKTVLRHRRRSGAAEGGRDGIICYIPERCAGLVLVDDPTDTLKRRGGVQHQKRQCAV
jgi:hypothetical protein